MTWTSRAHVAILLMGAVVCAAVAGIAAARGPGWLLALGVAGALLDAAGALAIWHITTSQ